MNIESYLGIGRENAVTRTELMIRTGLPDRTVRRMIADARDDGMLILNVGDGYYISNDIGEIERQYRTDRKRALSVLRRLKTMRRILKDAGVDV